MSSLFAGKTGLRTQYFEMSEAEINAATDVANAHLLGRIKNQCRITLLNNGFNTEVAVYLVHPDNDISVVGNRIFWLNLPPQTPLNFDISGTVGLSLDVNTAFYIVKVGADATNTAKMRLFAWG